MKNFFAVLGVIFTVLIVAAVIGFFTFKYIGNGLDKESKSYVDSNIPHILKNWDAEELIKRASPEFLAVAPREKIEQLFTVFSKRLGHLQEYKGSKGEAHLSVTAQKGKMITGEYVANAGFEKASATIHSRVIKRGDNWQILEFRVNSNAMFP